MVTQVNQLSTFKLQTQVEIVDGKLQKDGSGLFGNKTFGLHDVKLLIGRQIVWRKDLSIAWRKFAATPPKEGTNRKTSLKSTQKNG